MTLPTPDEVDRHVRALRKLVDWALDDHGHVAAYRWAHSGLSGLRSRTAGSLGSPGHSDPVPSQADLERCAEVEAAGKALMHAMVSVRAALEALREPDRKRETPHQILRGWTPTKETEQLRQKQLAREAQGGGYGVS